MEQSNTNVSSSSGNASTGTSSGGFTRDNNQSRALRPSNVANQQEVTRVGGLRDKISKLRCLLTGDGSVVTAATESAESSNQQQDHHQSASSNEIAPATLSTKDKQLWRPLALPSIPSMVPVSVTTVQSRVEEESSDATSTIDFGSDQDFPFKVATRRDFEGSAQRAMVKAASSLLVLEGKAKEISKDLEQVKTDNKAGHDTTHEQNRNIQQTLSIEGDKSSSRHDETTRALQQNADAIHRSRQENAFIGRTLIEGHDDVKATLCNIHSMMTQMKERNDKKDEANLGARAMKKMFGGGN